MKKFVLFFLLIPACIAFADTYLEDHLEDMLEARYGYISDESKYLELDFDIYEERNTVYVRVTVDDDSYREKPYFNRKVFDNYVRQIEKAAKNEVKGKNVIVNSYF